MFSWKSSQRDIHNAVVVVASRNTRLKIHRMMERRSFAKHGSMGADSEATGATKMYFKEVASMIVIVGGEI
jgi:hypothetical protein